MNLKSIKDAEIKNKKIILRAELDVPLKEGKIISDSRLRTNIPTINYLLEKGVKQILIIGHIGRPNQFEEDKSTKLLINRFEELINKNIFFADNFDEEIPDKKIVLFENTRFFKEEKNNDEIFCKKIAKHGELFVNNCFSTLTRDHASITGIAEILPSYAGLRVIEEISALSMKNKENPKALILGGVKMETKLPVIRNMLNKVDKIILGSATVILFLKALGKYKGRVLFDYDNLNELLEFANNPKIVYPIDFACSKTKTEQDLVYKKTDEIEEDDYVLDIGPETINYFKEILKDNKTIIWNGPLGYYERKDYAIGSIELAKFLGNLNCFVLVGGGDTEEILNMAEVSKKIDHICVGGGSMLKFLENNTILGLKYLIKD